MFTPNNLPRNNITNLTHVIEINAKPFIIKCHYKAIFEPRTTYRKDLNQNWKNIYTDSTLTEQRLSDQKRQIYIYYLYVHYCIMVINFCGKGNNFCDFAKPCKFNKFLVHLKIQTHYCI